MILFNIESQRSLIYRDYLSINLASGKKRQEEEEESIESKDRFTTKVKG